MSSLHYETLEDDLVSLLDDLKTKVTKDIPSMAGEEQKSAVRYAERGFEEAYSLLTAMEDQAKVAPMSYRTKMLGKVRNYRRSFDDLYKSMQRIQTLGTKGRDNDGFDRIETMENVQKNRMIEGNRSLNRASESIARSQRVAAETDEIGVNIIDELDSQRESLIRTKDRLTDTDSNLSRSRKLLKSMALRALSSKLILMMVIVVELAILGGLVYWKFFSGGSKKHTKTATTSTTTSSMFIQ